MHFCGDKNIVIAKKLQLFVVICFSHIKHLRIRHDNMATENCGRFTQDGAVQSFGGSYFPSILRKLSLS